MGNLIFITLSYGLAAGCGFYFLPRFFSMQSFEKILENFEKSDVVFRDGKVIAPTAKFFTALNITPNMITLFGVCLTVILGYLFFYEFSWPWLMVVGIFAALTDMFDGSLARLTNQVTELGGFLDGARDFLLFAVLTAGLIYQNLLTWELFLWFGVGSLFILALKVVSIFISATTLTLGNAFRKRCAGDGKLEVDRVKVFLYFSGLLMLLGGNSYHTLIPLGNFLVVISIVTVVLSIIFHSAIFKFRLLAMKNVE